MLTNSRDIVRRLEQEGWTLVRVTGSHHVFKNPVSGETVVVPHPRMEARLRFDVSHYIAIIEDAGPDHAVGVWFPDLPGGTSAGEDIDEALRNAPEALELYADSLEADGKPLQGCRHIIPKPLARCAAPRQCLRPQMCRRADPGTRHLRHGPDPHPQ